MGSFRRNLMSSDTLSSTQVLTSNFRLGSFRKNSDVGRVVRKLGSFGAFLPFDDGGPWVRFVFRSRRRRTVR
jgi:hypothetical protein